MPCRSRPAKRTVVDGLVSRSAGLEWRCSPGQAVHVCEKTEEWACRALGVEFASSRLAGGQPGRWSVRRGLSQAQVPAIGISNGNQERSRRKWPAALTAQFKGPDRLAGGTALRPRPGRVWRSRRSTARCGLAKAAGGEGCPQVLRHETPLADIAFSADGSLLATGSYGWREHREVFRAVGLGGAGATPGPPAARCAPGRRPAGDDAERRILSISTRQRTVWTAPRPVDRPRPGRGRFPCVAEPEPDPEPEPVPPPTQARSSRFQGTRCYLPPGRSATVRLSVPLQDPTATD